MVSHALGGGCELAMLCDMVNASLELKLGTIPGMGRQRYASRFCQLFLTLRLTALGKSKAMEGGLSGEMYAQITGMV